MTFIFFTYVSNCNNKLLTESYIKTSFELWGGNNKHYIRCHEFQKYNRSIVNSIEEIYHISWLQEMNLQNINVTQISNISTTQISSKWNYYSYSIWMIVRCILLIHKNQSYSSIRRHCRLQPHKIKVIM